MVGLGAMVILLSHGEEAAWSGWIFIALAAEPIGSLLFAARDAWTRWRRDRAGAGASSLEAKSGGPGIVP